VVPRAGALHVRVARRHCVRRERPRARRNAVITREVAAVGRAARTWRIRRAVHEEGLERRPDDSVAADSGTATRCSTRSSAAAGGPA
jgi:hypothetical protein